MISITLQQVSSKQAKCNSLSGLRIGVKQNYLERYLSSDDMEVIDDLYGDSFVHLWGVKADHGAAWANMYNNNTLVLFREGKIITMRGVSVYKIINQDLAEDLWGYDDSDGETWPLLYFLTKVQKIDLKVLEVNECLGYSSSYNWQKFNTVRNEKTANCLNKLLDKLKGRRH